jgi:hypothetical protein
MPGSTFLTLVHPSRQAGRQAGRQATNQLLFFFFFFFFSSLSLSLSPSFSAYSLLTWRKKKDESKTGEESAK